jgi:hypothetical protein
MMTGGAAKSDSRCHLISRLATAPSRTETEKNEQSRQKPHRPPIGPTLALLTGTTWAAAGGKPGRAVAARRWAVIRENGCPFSFGAPRALHRQPPRNKFPMLPLYFALCGSVFSHEPRQNEQRRHDFILACAGPPLALLTGTTWAAAGGKPGRAVAARKWAVVRENGCPFSCLVAARGLRSCDVWPATGRADDLHGRLKLFVFLPLFFSIRVSPRCERAGKKRVLARKRRASMGRSAACVKGRHNMGCGGRETGESRRSKKVGSHSREWLPIFFCGSTGQSRAGVSLPLCRPST